ncbi:MAG: PepSY-associated TM helix domain-containing protein [Pseudomonadota bacterium]
MSFLTQSRTKRLLAIHGWSGTILGLLLYAVIVTGAVVVFEHEIDTWSQGVLQPHENLGTTVDRHFRTHAQKVDRKYYEEVRIFPSVSGDIRYLFHTHESDAESGQIVETGIELAVDPKTGKIVDRWEGNLADRPGDPASALRSFLVDLHVQLYVPAPWGLILTGILGLAMMAAAVSGILIHKHLIRDAFLAARDTKRLVGARDLHVLAGTWGLPFAFLLAFTGAFFSFAISVGFPAMVMVAFDGNQEAAIEAIMGSSEKPDLTPAPMANLDEILADAVSRTGGTVNSIQIMHHGSAAAKVMVNMAAAGGDLAPTNLGYEGMTGAFQGERPSFGQAPSLGETVFSIIAPLHFGNFAGLASKTVWFGLGLAMAWVTATGMLLWTKRREELPLWQRFRHVVTVVIWGLPLGMLTSAAAYFLALPVGDPEWWTPLGFMIGAAAAIVLGIRHETATTKLRMATALMCLGLPLLRHLTGGTSWSEALMAGAGTIMMIDMLLMAAGVMLLRRRRAVPKQLQPASLHEPAE